MKTKSTLFLFFHVLSILFVSAQSSPAPELPRDISENWFDEASANIRQMEYEFYPGADNFHVTNSAIGVGFLINEKGYSASNLQDAKNKAPWKAEIILNSIGRTQPSFYFSTGHGISKGNNMLINHFGFADVEYINNEKGMRQNFIVNERPSGHGQLRIELGLQTSLSTKLIDRSSLVFYAPGNSQDVKLIYSDLNVWDADKKKLDAWMELNNEGDKLSLVVNDKNAVYPITIDPLNQTPEWTTSANGVLPGLLNTLTLQVQTLYGYNVVNLGDINGDTYDDVAISAPGMANVITGSGSLLGVGAVFIYKGSSTGLHTTPDKVLQPGAAPAGALFGFSIEAGNISGDGFSDIVVGAPMDAYQTTVTGLLGNVNVDVTAGKVYYYRSEDLLAASNPSPFAQIRLQGDNFFGIGILGLFDNTGVKALFGYSVGITDDLNGDGRQDIVIGCPSYLGKNIGDIQSGAAFVYYSNNLNTTSPVQLAVPTPSVLGLITLPLANLNGLLFGFSVEGAGDYNNDGKPDVVVGAPAGINLNSLGGIFSGQVLGGSAYVYYGNGTGVNTSIGASLQGAVSGLLGNAANLFGYKIKAVKNAAGARNGNILISSVTGNVLSNVIGGLRLKAGQVHVFKKKTGAFTNPVSSDQVLSSPRSSSVLSLLAGQNLDVSMLYGAGMDNMRDINCDGNADIIIGEPLSANVPLIGANVTGGAAYAYLGQADGTYSSTPSWSMFAEVSPLLGVNATSLLGFSVAGGIHSNGPTGTYRAIVGGPSNSLDFGVGLLDLGNTLGTLFSFTFDNNGLGKAYSFETNLCLITLPVKLQDFGGQTDQKSVLLNWKSTDELDVNMYELQRSEDSKNFETVAVVFAKNGQYNTYNYPDMHPLYGINYYRLKIVDNDRKVEYSKIISFRFDEKLPGFMLVAPNPVREVIRVRLTGFAEGDYAVRIYGNSGQLVMIKKINITRHDQVEAINREAGMLPGSYWLHLSDSKGKTVRTVSLVIGD